MSFLLLTPDLLFGSYLEGIAAASHHSLKVVATVAQLLASSPERASLVLLDLETPGLDPADMVPQLQRLDPCPKIVAYAPHVHTLLLGAARHAGCNATLTRGQLHRDAQQLFAAHAPGAE